MDEHPLNIEVCNYDQWLTLVEERNHLRAKLAQAESERDEWAKIAANRQKVVVALQEERDAARQAAAAWKMYAKSINWAMRQSYPRYMVRNKVRHWAYRKFGYHHGVIDD